MSKILMVPFLSLVVSSVVWADEEVTCAGGAGISIVGGVSGVTYCKSKNTMDWWNAVAWCDGLGKRLVDLSVDCGFTSTSNKCPNLSRVGDGTYVWTATPKGATLAHVVNPATGTIYDGSERSTPKWNAALCR